MPEVVIHLANLHLPQLPPCYVAEEKLELLATSRADIQTLRTFDKTKCITALECRDAVDEHVTLLPPLKGVNGQIFGLRHSLVDLNVADAVCTQLLLDAADVFRVRANDANIRRLDLGVIQ